MLQTIFTVVGLILMAIIIIVAMNILAELRNEEKKTSWGLLFSKMDHSHLVLKSIQDNSNTQQLRDNLKIFMQQRENASAQMLASMEEARGTIKEMHETLQRIENRLEIPEEAREEIIARNDKLDGLFVDVHTIRQLTEEGAVEAAKSTEDLIAKVDEECSEAKEPEPEPEEEPHKALGAAEKYELMKEMLEGGAEWKTIAREFGYSRSRDARRFYERYEAKNK